MTTTPSEPLLPRQSLDRLVTLESRELRVEVINMFRRLPTGVAPVNADLIRRVIGIDQLVFRAINSDLRNLLADPSQPEAEGFVRDIALLNATAGKAYLELIDRRAEWAGSDNEAVLHHTAHLAMHHFGEATKWALFRHEPLPATTWPQLYRVYCFAEDTGICHNELALFDTDDADIKTTILARFLRPLILDLLNSNNLSNVQIEVASAWLTHWCPSYQLDPHFDETKHRLFIDFDALAGLQLVTDQVSSERCRFLHVDAVFRQLAEVHESLRIGRLFGGPLVAQFAIADHIAVASTIGRVSAALFDPRSVAVEARKTISSQDVFVVTGYARICNALQGKPDSADLAIPGPPKLALALQAVTGEHDAIQGDTPIAGSPSQAQQNVSSEPSGWRLNDVSGKGLGFEVAESRAAGAETGELLLVNIRANSAAENAWRLANIARRSSSQGSARQGRTSLRIGAEVLSEMPIAVTARRISRSTEPPPELTIFDPTVGESQLNDHRSGMLSAIYLPGDAEDARTDTIVFALAEIGASNMVEVTAPAGKFVLRLSRVVRKGKNWIAYRFDVLEQRQ